MKKESIFKAVLNKVSKLAWLKGNALAKNKNMRPGKGFNKPVADHAFDYIKELDDHEFNNLISLIFKQRGYSISKKEESNENADLILEMDGQQTFVQYKHWREYEIDLPVLEDFHKIIEQESIRNGIVITTGLFTQEALEYSHSNHLLLINGVDLSLMIDVLSSSNIDDIQDDEPVEKKIEDMPELEPLCPICSQAMIKRTARKGKNAGNTFWGCSQFPNCRGVISN